MPIYRHQCKECDAVFEVLSSFEDRKTTRICPDCSGESEYIISAPYCKPTIDSDRWIKKRESHMKKERKNMENHGTYD